MTLTLRVPSQLVKMKGVVVFLWSMCVMGVKVILMVCVHSEMEQAADYAYNERRNEDELNLVLQQCTMADRAVFDRIQRYKLQLRNS